MKARLGFSAILLCNAACTAVAPPASPPALEHAAAPSSSTSALAHSEPPAEPSPAPPQGDVSSAPPEPQDGAGSAPAEQPNVERQGPYIIERRGDQTCLRLAGHSTSLCGSRVRGPRTKVELVDIRGSLDRAAAWEGLARVPIASKECWDRGPDDIVEAHIFVGPQGDVRSASASRGGAVAECMLPILRAARFPHSKESTRIAARLIRVP